MRQLRLGAGRANFWLLPLLAFVLPLSTSAVSVVAILILLLWLFEGNLLEKCAEAVLNPVSAAVLAYLALVCAGLLWTHDLAAGAESVRDHWKMALLPVFMTVAKERNRSLCSLFFLAGMSAAMLVTFLAWFGLVQYADVSPTHLTPKTFHVVYNPLLAFAVYLALHEAVWGRYKTTVRAGMFVLAGLMALNMFMTEGRTGQAVFLVLMGLLLLQVFSRRKFSAVLAACLMLPSICAVGYLSSPVFQQRVDAAWREFSGFRKNPNTSVGLRMQFCKNSFELIRQHPCVGVGTGDFQAAYSEINRQRSPRCLTTDNPHNQYMLTAVVLGLPGILSLLLIFAVMFRQAWRTSDDSRRIGVAFPLFFLVIMLAESYLKVYETAFFFSLFAAVLYKETMPSPRQALPKDKKCWLILSYRANIPGSACSQHIDDRLPFFREQGIEPVLLTGPVGERAGEWMHFRAFSVAPSGIRFELRHFLRKHLRRRWQFKAGETLLLLPILPFYVLEKIIVNLESEWSWCVLASLRGLLLCRELQPEVVYSTGGSASAHVAALLIKWRTGVRWLAETQDPLVHDQGWRRGPIALHLYKVLERMICARANAFVFLVRAAKEHCQQRTGSCGNAAVVYPGSMPAWFSSKRHAKGSRCRFAHFGSLAGTRNLKTFFQALDEVLVRRPALRSIVQVDVYGSFDGGSEREMKRLQLDDLVSWQGPVPRLQALEVMQQADCLLLIQNIIYFSCETIPSKVYEYLLSGRPVIGLLHRNQELQAMLEENGHQTVPADDVKATAAAIEKTLLQWLADGLPSKAAGKTWTTADAVGRLIQLTERRPCN